MASLDSFDLIKAFKHLNQNNLILIEVKTHQIYKHNYLNKNESITFFVKWKCSIKRKTSKNIK